MSVFLRALNAIPSPGINSILSEKSLERAWHRCIWAEGLLVSNRFETLSKPQRSLGRRGPQRRAELLADGCRRTGPTINFFTHGNVYVCMYVCLYLWYIYIYIYMYVSKLFLRLVYPFIHTTYVHVLNYRSLSHALSPSLSLSIHFPFSPYIYCSLFLSLPPS